MFGEIALDETVRWLHKWGLEVSTEINFKNESILRVVGPIRFKDDDSDYNYGSSYIEAKTGDWITYDPSALRLRVFSNDEFVAGGR